MNRSMLASSCLLAVIASGCGKRTDGTASSSSVSQVVEVPVPVSSMPSKPAHAVYPVPKAIDVSCKASDGLALRGSLWKQGNPKVGILLVHRLGGARQEWMPLVERLFDPSRGQAVLGMDLRGHGDSTKQRDGKQLVWHKFALADVEKMKADLGCWISELKTQAKVDSFVLVGSDIGATAAVHAGAELGQNLCGVALVSPGAKLRGWDLYEPFARIKHLPNLVILATHDTVSVEPAGILTGASATTELITLDGREHSAEHIGQTTNQGWDRLIDWINEREQGVSEVSPAASATAPLENQVPPIGSVM